MVVFYLLSSDIHVLYHSIPREGRKAVFEWVDWPTSPKVKEPREKQVVSNIYA